MEDAMAMLAKSGKTPEELYKALCEQRVDLVFTAHPTQAMRGSVRKKYVNLFQDLRKLLHKMPNVEHHEIMEDMYANVQVTPSQPSFSTLPNLRNLQSCHSPQIATQACGTFALPQPAHAVFVSHIRTVNHNVHQVVGLYLSTISQYSSPPNPLNLLAASFSQPCYCI